MVETEEPAMKKIKSAVALVLGVTLLAAGCSGSGKGSGGGTESSSSGTTAAELDTSQEKSVHTEVQDATKDDFVFTIISEPANIGQEVTNNNGRLCTIQVYDSLIKENGGDRTDLLPNLATEWEFSEDGKTLTFTIKDGVKFHNGDTMTAEDVAFSLDHARKLSTNASTGNIIEDVQVVDDSHVALTLAYPYKPILNIIAQPQYCIYNKAYTEKCESEGTVMDRCPMGTGPYKFVNWVSGEEINFERFDDYHDQDHVAKMKNLKVKIMTDATTAALAIENGECDAFLGVNTADMPRLDANEDTIIYRTTSTGYHLLTLNTRKAPFDNQKVRQAIAKAINVEEVFVGGHDGIGWITTQPITYGIFGYDKNFEAMPYDLEGAKQLLAEAGYPDGFKCTLKVKQDSYYSTPAQICVEQLRKLGLDIDIKIQETGTYDTEVDTNFDYDIAYEMTVAQYPDADATVFMRLHSSCINSPKGNVAGAVNEDLDKLIEEARYELDDEKRLELYREISEINKEESYYIPLVTSTNSVVVRKEVQGAYAHGGGQYRISDWSYVAE